MNEVPSVPDPLREWLLQLMGDWDFTIPTGAFNELVAALVAQQRAETPPVQTAMAVVRDAGYLVTPPDRPTDRINLANLRRVMDEWHTMACSIGFDGVKSMLEQAGAIPKECNEH